MTAVIAPKPRVRRSSATKTLFGGVTALVVLGVILAPTADHLFGFLLVVAAGTLPAYLWINAGALGIPIVPAVGLAYIGYFGIPMITGTDIIEIYPPSEILRSGATVAMFLVTATAVWRLMCRLRNPVSTFAIVSSGASQVVRLIAFGYLMGIVFHLGILYEWFTWLGSFFGVVRTFQTSLLIVACFLSGVTHAQGILQGRSWWMVLGATALIVAMAWSSLFLVGGMLYILALVCGHAIVARRLPWAVMAAVVIAVAVLHAGKADMRMKYWGPDPTYASGGSVFQLPALATEWVAQGVSNIATGDVAQSAFERVSLLQMMLLVQSLTPDTIDFLRGETYALLPQIMVPRFIETDKPASQAAMTLLNNRYGLQTLEESAVTAIGWGLVPEAFANFGYWGVGGIGVVVGLFCGWLSIWAARAEVVSTATLFSIAAMMILLNIEADFIQIATSLMQAFAVVFAFITAYRWLTKREQRRLHAT